MNQLENETRIIERRLKDVSDPLSEEDENSTPTASRRSVVERGSIISQNKQLDARRNMNKQTYHQINNQNLPVANPLGFEFL